ncbi:MAG: DNA-3-methyladenine glycosylase [Negativicutes bacterium]|nr:DNA-3-methyladenine glycosylase [Negativicutes bacterium]MBP8628964.1 DNA-3-methyladenine glycosylase [Negativicutes bacterium]MBP9536902.1 DNA-3-methyladenine glycosylase [Negativicutes bacterium]MBP9949183.1 DNA-3-methyladenine glycosylase [Negativicutes bacterium]
MHILDKKFFEQEAVVVAQELLGCILTYETKRGILSGKIVETEAYGGIDDKASHAAKGVTARNAVMFGEAGLAYIYLIYGMYNCFNIVTGKNNQAQAVLIRALEPMEGIEIMQEYRKQSKIKMLCNGPGKLCQAFGINRALNGISLLKPPIYIKKRTEEFKSIDKSKRINIDYAEEATEFEWRFYIEGNKFLSK